MVRVAIDQDITPTPYLIAQLPDSWDCSVELTNVERDLPSDLEDVDIALVTSRVPMTAEVIQSTDSLNIIGKSGTGLDNVDVEAARENGIEVTYTPGLNALSVAEHTLMHMLSTARRLPETRRVIEEGGWRDSLSLGTLISGSTVGIIGFGNIGQRVAGLLNGFNVNVIAYDPYVPEIDTEPSGADLVALDTLLEESDIISVNAQKTPETTGMIDAEAFERMKPSAILLNMARGPLVNEDALIDALVTGSINGAGLDAHSTEPIEPDSPLLEMDNVVLTPHSGPMTTKSRQNTMDRLVENIVSLEAGETLFDRWLAPGDPL